MSQKVVVPKITSSLSPESERIIRDFLFAHPVGVLATVDGNKPHATTVYFGSSEDFVITFTTKVETKKNKVLSGNNSTYLVTFDASSQTTAQVIGRAVEITDFVDAKNAFDATVDAATKTSEDGVPPIAKLYAGKYIAYQLVPERINLAIFASPEPGSYDLYQTIEFAAI